MKYLTLDEALDLVESLCGEKEMDALQDGEYKPTELSEFASQIYKIIHAHRGNCENPHLDWKIKADNNI